MAVSKRTRYEVLRRDNFTCRYCRSSEGEMVVDHVTPIALGGSDDPSNLVAACRDCNAGKASTSPEAATVADVRDDELRWSAALAKAAEITTEQASWTKTLTDWFEDTWYLEMPQWAYLPDDWKETVIRFESLGVSTHVMRNVIEIVATKHHVEQRARFKYFCGICWNKVRELQEIARQILAAEEAGGA
jgi:hypothetical protein